jgi:uncharacterized membrane protein YjgN (DUF898 family)
MEIITPEKKNYNLKFIGNGETFFGIIIINWLLTIITFGFYYPWAKAKKLQYLYGHTNLNNETFEFHGTGKEMFKGFIKVILLFLALYAVLFLLIFLKMPFVGLLVFYAGILAILPLAIHGSYRYRMSRTSWRGIRFGYRGDRKELTINFFKWLGLTILTLGIYSSWMSMTLRNYLIGNVRFGNAKMNYDGDGGDYFLLNLKGYFLTLITFGIYIFWWQKELFEYYVNNLTLHKEDQKIAFNSTVSGGGIFSLIFVNLFILIFTLGFGYAWVAMRTLRYLMENIKIEGDLDLDSLTQTEEEYKDAMGEDIGDMLELDFVF